jgi:transglutaminase-like putative cysteine protease
MWAQLVEAHTNFATAVSPVPANGSGFKLVAVLAVGLVAVLADWAAFRWRSAVCAGAPPFAYFIACCVFGQGPNRSWTIVAEVSGLLVFMLVHRVTVGRASLAWFGNQRTGNASWALTTGCLLGAVSLAAALVVTPLVGRNEGNATLGWHNGFGGGSGPRQVPNPVVDLHTRLLNESQTPVFTVQSTVPSYWRLTSLDTFTGEDWVSTDSYRGFGARLPGVQAVPPGTRLIKEQFQIQQLDSVWLPDAFTPVSVTGVRHVSYDPVSGSLITSKATSNGLDYTVESYQYLSTLHAANLENAPPVTITPALRPYLQLPDEIPSPVVTLAKQIIAGQTTEYDKALALQNFFLNPRSGFTYTISPPDNGYGISSLVNFLFFTRSGFCQQFAGSYAVLARAIGLPTRLAVGFATGAKSGSGYQVTDADAHAWPEVYFGPNLGWLPFEPTKGFADPASNGYAPSSGGSLRTAPNGPGGTIDPRNPTRSTTTVPGAAAPAPPTTAAGAGISGAVPAKRGVNGVGVFILALVLLSIAWAGLVVGGRRARWQVRRWKSRHDSAGLALVAWAEVTEVLNWVGARHFPGETNEEFANRAAQLVAFRLRDPSASMAGRIRRSARMATEATFASAVASELGGQAAAVAREVRRSLLRAAGWRQRLTWILVPRPFAGAVSRRGQTSSASGPGGPSPQKAGAGATVRGTT